MKKLGSLNSPSFCIFLELLPSLPHLLVQKIAPCNNKDIKEERKENNITKINLTLVVANGRLDWIWTGSKQTTMTTTAQDRAKNEFK